MRARLPSSRALATARTIPLSLKEPEGLLVTGWLRAHYGYHAGFSAAAIGMAFALVAFVYGRSKLSAFAFDVPNPLDAEDRSRLLLVSLGAAAAIALAAGALYGLLGSLSDTIAYTTFVIALGASIAYFVIMFRSPKVTGPERTMRGKGQCLQVLKSAQLMLDR